MNLLVNAQDEDEGSEVKTTTTISKEEACSVGCENGWCWGTDKTTATEKNVLYTDMLDNKNYEGAKEPLEWLLTNTPCLNKSIYINVEKLYKALLKAEKDPAKKEAYQDKIIKVLYNRIKYFGQEITVKNKIGFLMYAYMVNRGENTLSSKEPHWTKMYDFYADLIKLTGDNSHYAIVKYYFQSAAKMHKLKKLSDDELLEIYDSSIEIIEKASTKAKDNIKKKWAQTKVDEETTLMKEITIDCDFVKKNWVPKIKANPENVKLEKKAIRFMIQGKCTDDPEFMNLVEILYKEEKTSGMAKLLAKHYLGLGNLDKAESYFKEMIVLAGGGKDSEAGSTIGGTVEEDLTIQAEGYLEIGKIKQKQGNYSTARNNYLKAASIDAEIAKDAYSKVGDLYYTSWKRCLANGGDLVKDKTPYFAAYDMYQKAGNGGGMARSKAQFPTKTDLFTIAKYKEGQSISVGCWIGGSTTIRSR
ncbi:MAG: tetratricopeptide (TPR) repeat protein [Flammeovirgaceae bacterium]|jgi:tetratricopeptide (TPR) repeat protein